MQVCSESGLRPSEYCDESTLIMNILYPEEFLKKSVNMQKKKNNRVTLIILLIITNIIDSKTNFLIQILRLINQFLMVMSQIN
jgi:hypothetical protein